MSKRYGNVGVAPLSFDYEASWQSGALAHLVLSPKDVLGIVQSALDDLATAEPELIAVKRDVLEAVSEGKLAEALRTAIVGAGQRTCSCC